MAVCQEPTQSRLLTGLTPLLPPMTQALLSFAPPLPLPQAVFDAAQDTLCQAQRTLNAVYKLVKNKTSIQIWARREEKQWWWAGSSQGMINDLTQTLICMF